MLRWVGINETRRKMSLEVGQLLTLRWREHRQPPSHATGIGEAHRIAFDGADIVVPRDQPHAPRRAPIHGLSGAQLAEDWVRIADKVRRVQASFDRCRRRDHRWRRSAAAPARLLYKLHARSVKQAG